MIPASIRTPGLAGITLVWLRGSRPAALVSCLTEGPERVP
jgi:hypothetical protein